MLMCLYVPPQTRIDALEADAQLRAIHLGNATAEASNAKRELQASKAQCQALEVQVQQLQVRHTKDMLKNS